MILNLPTKNSIVKIAHSKPQAVPRFANTGADDDDTASQSLGRLDLLFTVEEAPRASATPLVDDPSLRNAAAGWGESSEGQQYSWWLDHLALYILFRHNDTTTTYTIKLTTSVIQHVWIIQDDVLVVSNHSSTLETYSLSSGTLRQTQECSENGMYVGFTTRPLIAQYSGYHNTLISEEQTPVYRLTGKLVTSYCSPGRVTVIVVASGSCHQVYMWQGGRWTAFLTVFGEVVSMGSLKQQPLLILSNGSHQYLCVADSGSLTPLNSSRTSISKVWPTRIQTKSGTIEAPHFRTSSSLNRGTIMLLHGGPIEHITLADNAGINALAQLGYDIVAPNYAGSTGYGDKHIRRLIGQLGRADLDDVLTSINYVTSHQGPKALHLFGVSYGAYLALQALAATDANTIDSLTLVSGFPTLESLSSYGAPPQQRLLCRLLGQQCLPRDEDVIIRKALRTYSGRVLAIYGEKDDRIPVQLRRFTKDLLFTSRVDHLYVEVINQGHYILQESIQYFRDYIMPESVLR